MKMQKLKIPLVLASGSPRRRELLSLLGLPYSVLVSDAEERANPFLPPELVVQELSAIKAQSVASRCPEPSLILGADTIVVLDGQILGKPSTPQEAHRMLRLLQNRDHLVYTGICLAGTDGTIHAKHSEKTLVRFSPISDQEIEEYVSTGEPMDKAGAYAIQGGFARFITGIEGCYYNVMGLPLHAVYTLLKPFLCDA